MDCSLTPHAATTPRNDIDNNYEYEDYDEGDYFSQTYVPLSSLPTPPTSSYSESSRVPSPEFENQEDLDSSLLGPAIHLSNLIPSAVSLLDPSVHLVQGILARANLPLDTVALAVCILDSLNSRFAHRWRRNCPITSDVASEQHIDRIRPELIILASLNIAVKFLDDHEEPTKHIAEYWGERRWTCEQINATEQVIMENLGWRILPLWNEELIGDALGDMLRAGTLAKARRRISAGLKAQAKPQQDQTPKLPRAVWTAENQLTPEDSPRRESRAGRAESLPTLVENMELLAKLAEEPCIG